MESKTSHTPGPWKAVESKLTPGFWSIESASGDVTYITLENGSLAANARLISAAPELLEVAIMVKAYFERPGAIHGIEDPCWHAARAAIEKAKGSA